MLSFLFGSTADYSKMPALFGKVGDYLFPVVRFAGIVGK